MNENKKIALNSFILFIRLCIVSVIGLLSARYVLQALGAADYGLYNVVGGIVALLNVVNTAMLTTTYRYIAYELGKGEKGHCRMVFNTSLAIHVFFGFMILVVGLPVGEWYVSNCLNVCTESISNAHFVLRISIFTTMISTILVPYQGLLVAFERFNISAVIDILTQIFKLIAIVVILNAAGNGIKMYAIIMLFYTILSSSMYLFYCHRHYNKICKYKFYKDRNLYKEMFSFTGWILFGACSSVGKTQGSAMIINFFFGTVVNAAFAIANQVEAFILMFARMLNQAAVPQITKSFSSGDAKRSVKLASYISKYTFILMSLVAFPVIMEMDFLLSLWLKKYPEGTSLFCQLMILGCLIGCMGEGIPALTQASGRIKYFQLILSSIALLGLPISFVSYKLGAASYAILIIYSGISLLTAFIRLLLLKYILKIKISIFVKTSYSRMFVISVPLIMAFIFYDSEDFTTLQHFIALFFLEVFLIIDIMLLGIDKNERSVLKNIILKKFRYEK